MAERSHQIRIKMFLWMHSNDLNRMSDEARAVLNMW
jgi:hypothetical protein